MIWGGSCLSTGFHFAERHDWDHFELSILSSSSSSLSSPSSSSSIPEGETHCIRGGESKTTLCRRPGKACVHRPDDDVDDDDDDDEVNEEKKEEQARCTTHRPSCSSQLIKATVRRMMMVL